VIEETFNSSSGQVATVEPLTYGEEITLLYVGGYICHKLLMKITASKHPMRDQLLLCLQDLCDKNDEILSSADWKHAVDRVDLCVSVKAHAHYSNKWHSACHDAGSKKELHETIITDEDIAFPLEQANNRG